MNLAIYAYNGGMGNIEKCWWTYPWQCREPELSEESNAWSIKNMATVNFLCDTCTLLETLVLLPLDHT